MLENAQQLFARDAAEAVPARRDTVSVHDHIDVVPVRKVLGDGAKGRLIGGTKVLQRLVGEHDAPAEGVVGRVALEHDHIVFGPRLLEQQGRIQARWSASDHDDAHGGIV